MSTTRRPSAGRTAVEMRSDLVDRLPTIVTAWSVSGRDVGFTTGFDSGLEVGGFAIVTTPAGVRAVVQVHDLRLVEREGLRVDLDAGQLTGEIGAMQTAHVGLLLRAVSGSGHVLATIGPSGLEPIGTKGFVEASIEPASAAVVEQLIGSSIGTSSGLAIGTVGADGPEALLKAAGFSRHTFMVGQSGSGKTFSLGVVLERLLTDTSLPIVIIDPNSDYVHLGHLLAREKIAAKGKAPMSTRRYRELRAAMAQAGPVSVARSSGGDLPLRIHLSDLSLAEQALTLGLDPFRDGDEYAAFVDIVDELATEPLYGFDRLVERLQLGTDEWSQRLLQRIKNLRIGNWTVWAASSEPSLTSRLTGLRGLVLDTGSLADARERSVIALAVMGRLRRRPDRTPVLLVVDEAHNLLGPDPDSDLDRAVVDLGVWIAGEGRKYGIHMIVSTQRPQKIHRNIISQCDNLVLMRMNSHADIDELATVFSHVPRPMIAEARSFRQGELLVAGPIATPALRIRTGQRWCPEGGADLPTTWAEGSSPNADTTKGRFR